MNIVAGNELTWGIREGNDESHKLEIIKMVVGKRNHNHFKINV